MPGTQSLLSALQSLLQPRTTTSATSTTHIHPLPLFGEDVNNMTNQIARVISEIKTRLVADISSIPSFIIYLKKILIILPLHHFAGICYNWYSIY